LGTGEMIEGEKEALK